MNLITNSDGRKQLANPISVFYRFESCIFLATFKQNTAYSVHFKAWKVESFTSKDDYALEDESAFVEGGVKWDGCTNYTFPSSVDCMEHACSRKGLVEIGLLLGRIYDQCAEIMMTTEIFDGTDQKPVVTDTF